ncbi:DUF3558 domain-containing protein [Streptomyces sp. RS10V-4]|uniref:DUF3558 family protein n=1 Tax=Streptomyces rhizoryzae TaxID=2932493 RepID=UPI0020036E59|nr:DUF3558 family protein [Streptomyces rhizoryzae]MCK7621713.1 DUF3558 domain-containing protein [Streptomyces rhizoryzae]
MTGAQGAGVVEQWDEDRQVWTQPNPSEGAARPGTRNPRAAVVTAVAVVVCVAAGAGIWAWGTGREPGASGSGPPAATGPSASGSAPTGRGETAGAGRVPSDPCAAVSDELAQEWDLTHLDVQAKTGCRWHSARHKMLIRLSYLGEPPARWSSVVPIKVDGVPAAKSVDTGMTCMIMWPTSYGSVNLSASEVSGGGEDLCGAAARFAAAVAPHVPR